MDLLFLISPFIQIGPNCEQGPMPANLVWVFGHVYRRSFLNKHNIRMTPTRANEDVGYNKWFFFFFFFFVIIKKAY